MRFYLRGVVKFILIIALFILSINKTVSAKEFQSLPNKIIIPSTLIILDVKPAEIVFDTWNVRLDAASFGDNSALPGNKGNTIIFSHALSNLFGNLPNINLGDTINVFTDLDWFVYKVTAKNIVDPENVDVLNPVHSNQLTLFTCTGPEYLQRFVVTAELQSNTSSSIF